ncbi:TIM barrel protein [Neomoorella carbonis]|uniref:TIM barrel protein n=1 Tax=Neomoorella carbonis TaxID=3062783 RepID=UPI003255A3F9
MIITKKSVCIETIFTEVPFEERIKLAKDFGFEYIEFWTWKDKDIDKIKSICENLEIKVASFSGDQDFSLINEQESKEYISFVKDSIKTARYLDCQYLVLHSNALGKNGEVLNPHHEISDYKKFYTMVNVLKDLAPIAEEAKVTLALEALNTKIDHVGNFLAYTKDAVEVVKLINSPYIKILYDVYHMQIMEGDLINTIKKYIEVIGYVHIADVPGRHEPGTGEINFINVIETLKLLNYNGIIGFELYPLKDSKQAVAIINNL